MTRPHIVVNFTPFFHYQGIMMGWTVAGVATTVFLSLYDSEDFRERMNMKISPDFNYRLKLVAIMVVNFGFCYIWEVHNCEMLSFDSM